MVCLITVARAQVRHLVSTLSKKNHKISVAEIHNLVEMYGVDMHRFFLQCLVEELDFADQKTTKEQTKVQLLAQELNSVAQQPNFVSTICLTFSRLASLSDHPAVISKTLKLSLAMQITLGLALAQSTEQAVRTEGTKFLNLKVPDLAASNSNIVLQDHVLHNLFFFLQDPDNTPDTQPTNKPQKSKGSGGSHQGNSNTLYENVLKGLRQRFPATSVATHLAPQLFGSHRHSSDLASTRAQAAMVASGSTTQAASPAFVSNVIEAIQSGVPVWQCVNDLGPTCTHDAENLRLVLSQCSPLTDLAICNVLVTIVNAQAMPAAVTKNPNAEVGRDGASSPSVVAAEHNQPLDVSWLELSSLPTSGSSQQNAQAVDLDVQVTSANWDLKVFAQVVQQLRPNIQWPQVFALLDQKDVLVLCREAFVTLMLFFRNVSGSLFPAALFVGRQWKHVPAQLRLLQFTIEVDSGVGESSHSDSLIDFTSTLLLDDPNTQAAVEGNPNERFMCWRSVDLVGMLLELSEVKDPSQLESRCDDANGNGSSPPPDWQGPYYATCWSLFNTPLALCPELLLLALAHITAGHGAVLSVSSNSKLLLDLVDLVLPRFIAAASRAAASACLVRVFDVNINMVLEAILRVYARDQSVVLPIASLFQHERIGPNFLNAALDHPSASAHRLAINVACVAAKRELLNLEKWIGEALNAKRQSLVVALLAHLRSFVAHATATQTQIPQGLIQFELDVIAVIVRCLRTVMPSMSPSVIEEFKMLVNACFQVNPRLQNLINERHVFSPQVEAEAYAVFKHLFQGQMTVEQIVALMIRFRDSQNPAEQQVQRCMVQHLLDDYKFFSSYPDDQLRIVGRLFGQLIANQLFSRTNYTTALKSVLEALRSPPMVNPNLFKFGNYALDQFKTQLTSLHQYRVLVLQVPMLKQNSPQLYEYIEALHNQPQPQQIQQQQIQQQPQQQQQQQQLQQQAQQQQQQQQQQLAHLQQQQLQLQQQMQQLQLQQADITASPASQLLQSPAPSTSAPSPNAFPPIVPIQLEDSTAAQVTQTTTAPSTPNAVSPISGPSTPIPSTDNLLNPPTPGGTSSAPRSPDKMSFATPTSQNIDTLLAAAERKGLTWPDPAIQDKVHFIFNNVSSSNLDAKSADLCALVRKDDNQNDKNKDKDNESEGSKNADKDSENEDAIPETEMVLFLANYIVIKRASIEPNFHVLYVSFLECLNSPIPSLWKQVIEVTYDNIHVLLESPKVTSDLNERGLLKNLGVWLGLLTIAKNRPVLQRRLDLKALLVTAYQQSKLIAAVPFVCKILESCVKSRVFMPPNPWVVGILSLLREIYHVPNERMSLRFEVEMLHKKLGKEIKDSPVSNILSKYNSRSQVIIPQALMVPQFVAHRKLVALAVRTAMQEINSRELDRWVNNACLAASELVCKDFFVDGMDALPIGPMKRAAGLMVQSLAGSLALVNSKEPLREAIERNLVNLLTTHALPLDSLAINTIAVQAANDNLTLACSHVEKAAIERGLLSIDATLDASLNARKKQGYIPQQSMLPEQLLLSKSGYKFDQRNVYEAFGKPLNSQILSSPSVQTGRQSVNSTTSAASAFEPISAAPSPVPSSISSPMPQQDQSNIPGVGPISGVQHIVEKLVQALDSLHQHCRHVSSGALQQHRQAIFTLVEHFRVQLGQVPKRDATSVAVSLGRTALKQFFHLAVFNAQSPPLDSEVILQLLFVEAHMRILDMLITLCQTNAPILQKELTIIALASEPSHRQPGAAVGTLVRRGFISPADTNELLCKLIADAQANPMSASASAELKWCMSVIHAAIAPSPATVLASQQQQQAGAANPHSTQGLNEAIQGERRVSQSTAAHLNSALQALTCLNPQHPLHDHVFSTLRHVTTLVETTTMTPHASEVTQPSSMTHQSIPTSQPPTASPGPSPIPSPIPSPAPSPAPSSANLVLSPTPTSSVAPTTAAASAASTPTLQAPARSPEGSLQQKALTWFEEWMRALAAHQALSANSNSSTYVPPLESFPQCQSVVAHLQREHLLDGDEPMDNFFKICMEQAIAHASPRQETDQPQGRPQPLNYQFIDGLAKLVMVIYQLLGHPGAITTPLANISKPAFMAKALSMQCFVLMHDFTTTYNFDQRPYFRFLVNLLVDLNAPEMLQDSASTFTVLTAFANMFHSLQPTNFPSFAFSWMELVCHRLFMPRLLSAKPNGWALFHRLLVDLFKFMEPCLRSGQLNDAIRLLYKGTLRVLLVLLHDFPEFLCEYHFSLCDVIPPTCVQLRNLILSAFPRNMRLPDPFTPNLKVDLLPEIFETPCILSNVPFALVRFQIKPEIDEWITKMRAAATADVSDTAVAEAASETQSSLFQSLSTKMRLTPEEEAVTGTKYNVAIVNSLVLHVGMRAIELMMQQQAINAQNGSPPATPSPFTQAFAVDMYKHLVTSLDPEGRYLVLNAIVNQLRYPNNHTHYFSWIVLCLFAESNTEAIKEQITRVLLERLIVHRPHPWGLLITFIELIRNPRYDFWSHSFTHRAPEIKKLFESVAATCTSASAALSQTHPQSMSASQFQC